MRFSIASFLILTTLTSCLLVEWCFPPATWIQNTNNPLHLAIQGQGAFQLLDETTQETVVSRRGALRVDSDSSVVLTFDDKEYPIEPEMCVGEDSVAISITPAGLVKSQTPDGDWLRIGQIQLFKYRDERGLVRPTQLNGIDCQADLLFDCPQTSGFGRIEQGSIERLRIFSFHRVLACVTLCLGSLLMWRSNSQCCASTPPPPAS